MSFDLELAIKAWRDSLKTGRSFFKEDLEELERHLRDHTDSLIGRGQSPEKAFREARAHLGTYASLEKAYRTVFWRKLKHQQLILATIVSQTSMLRSYSKSAVRNLLRHKVSSTINVSGLAVGLACAFLVLLWAQSELSVDRFHEKGDQLFQVKVNIAGDTGISTWSNSPLPLAATMETTYPEVDYAVLTLPIRAALWHDGQASREKGYYASEGFFEAFSFPLIVGDPSQALTDPSSIVISDAVASKYFGLDWRSEASVVGQSFTMNYWQSDGGVLGQAVTENNRKEFTITGVFEDVPSNSSLRFDVVLPVAEVVRGFPHVTNWGPRWFELTLLLHPSADIEDFGPKVESLLSENVAGVDDLLILQPFGDSFLHGSFDNGVPAGGRIQQVYLIGLAGLAILLMACINFTNLVTARSNQRAREVGVRKAVGATPGSLMQQFLGESMLTAMVGFVGAVGLTVLALPLFNSIAGTSIAIATLTLKDWASFLGIALLTGCVAGSYPAFYLASFNVIRIFRSQAPIRRRGEVGLRRGLVIVQFGVSALFIVGTITVYQQLTYLQTKDLGLDKENVVMLRLEGEMNQQFDAVREALSQTPEIVSISRSSAHPVGVAIKNGNLVWEGKQADEVITFTVLRTDDQFARTMKLELTAGRFFEEERDAGLLRFVVNESAVRAMALDDPLGHPFAFGFDVEGGHPGSGQIIGVVKDFHTGSLAEEAIAPLVFRYEASSANFLLARVSPEGTADALAALERVHSTLNPGYVFDYSFLDETYQAYYEDEAILGTLSRLFALVAIFIACLGLFGLSAFAVQQRTKEIGVRRVLGASSGQVVYVLSREFVLLVALSLGLALPVSYWAMDGWLSSFTYHIDVGVWTLAVTALLSLTVAMLTVGYQANRANRLDPVRSLRSE